MFGDDSISNMDDLGDDLKAQFKEKDDFDEDTNDALVKGRDSGNLDILDSNAVELADEAEKDARTNDELNFASSLSSSPQSQNGGDNSKAELNSKLAKLMDELERIREERHKREIEIQPINNPVLKAHLSSRLNNLIEEENRKANEIEELKSLMND